ncbi:hypothetical protein BHE74_00044322 [Ensete ventricosum]|nr:hypothetical protein BHE74_00044322 [Ensete ventricosum]RZS20521.1 hypothetical protein BHM03_00053050 [Ensete ventricosum]
MEAGMASLQSRPIAPLDLMHVDFGEDNDSSRRFPLLFPTFRPNNCLPALPNASSCFCRRLTTQLKPASHASLSHSPKAHSYPKATLLLPLRPSLMEESNRDCYKQHCQRRCTGELIEVPGGHIVRSTGRKDRHSKVYTAKGVRDRRVRLAAHTAIQFYDVQDRLGYDRPSKAVDWLMQNAKTAIDQLADLPRCHAPVDRCVVHELPLQDTSVGHNSIEPPMSDAGAVASLGYGFGSSSSSLIPPSLDGDAIDDLVKPFPTVTAIASSPSSHAMTYHDYTPDLLLHACGRPQDLRLSLQFDPSFRDHHHQSPDSTQQFFCSGTTNLAHATTWATCPVNKERMGWWNAANPCDGSGAGEFSYNGALPPQSAAPRLVNAQAQLCTGREPLRSGNLSSLRAWTIPTAFHPSPASAAADVFTSESYAGFSGFQIPERVQGEEPHNAIANDLQAASSASRQWQKWKENNE